MRASNSWWLRSPYSGSATSFCYVNNNGYVNNNNASNGNYARLDSIILCPNKVVEIYEPGQFIEGIMLPCLLERVLLKFGL
ncbi:MAG: DUF6273 domain-containing protein [Christensenellales bacterium]